MEEIVLLDAAERYLNGEMAAQEKSYFEDLRRNNAEVDQMVVEHHLFLNQFENYGSQKKFKALLNETYNQLVEDGAISQAPVVTGGRVIRLWNKNKRTIAVAASIACVTALTISGMLSYISPKSQSDNQKIQYLSTEIDRLKVQQRVQSYRIQEIDGKTVKMPTDQTLVQKPAGSSFLIDIKGFLITNSHVVANAKAVVVSNNGKDYEAEVVYDNPATDLAILKITDPDFKALTTLPYSIRKSGTELGEAIFTLGYPRNLITYGQGYLSAQSGYDDDSLSVQISIAANPGNSGGPIFDKNGDVIGILSSREKNADGVVFANKASNIAKLLDKMRLQDTSYNSIKLPAKNLLKGKET
ncbi:MAG: serine protease, partial [Sphingobacteriaceae bacterium]